ncbi:hypothetical protein VCRA213O314_250034 [Vibrio crassostreae]|nr:hypothetical protein VCRA213O314_250034 [Vibrio crassostreae]
MVDGATQSIAVALRSITYPYYRYKKREFALSLGFIFSSTFLLVNFYY